MRISIIESCPATIMDDLHQNFRCFIGIFCLAIKLTLLSLIELIQGDVISCEVRVAIEAVMKSGWINDRNINIDHYEKVSKDELSIFNEHAAEFLSQFGGLEGSC